MKIELVDSDSEYKLGEYLYHHVTEEETMYRVESAELSHDAGPVAAVMTAGIKAKGVDSLCQTVVLYSDIKRIDFIVDMEEAPSGRLHRDFKYGSDYGKESVYFVFPFNIPGFRIMYELPGVAVEPIADQSEGSTTSHYGIQHFADISNDRFATNIQVDQRGPNRMTWSLRSHEGGWKEGDAYAFGREAAYPLSARVIDSCQQGTLPPDKYCFLRIDKPNVAVITLKPAESNGSGYILRCNELMGEDTAVTVSLPFLESIESATETSLLELDKNIPVKVN